MSNYDTTNSNLKILTKDTRNHNIKINFDQNATRLSTIFLNISSRKTLDKRNLDHNCLCERHSLGQCGQGHLDNTTATRRFVRIISWRFYPDHIFAVTKLHNVSFFIHRPALTRPIAFSILTLHQGHSVNFKVEEILVILGKFQSVKRKKVPWLRDHKSHDQ